MHEFISSHLDDIYMLSDGEQHDLTFRVRCLSNETDSLQKFDFIRSVSVQSFVDDL